MAERDESHQVDPPDDGDTHPRVKEPWLRQHKLAVIAIVATVVGIAVGGLFGYLNFSKPVGGSTVKVNSADIAPHDGGSVTINQTQVAAPVDANEACGAMDSNVVAGWGPERPLLGKDDLAPFPSFNMDSFPEAIGDERNFYGVKLLSDLQKTLWQNNIAVQDGGVYLLRVYIHNSGGSQPERVAKDTRITVNLPNCTGNRIASNAFIESSNAVPSSVWAGVNFYSESRFNVAYIEGSAQLCSNYFPCKGSAGGYTNFSNYFLTSKGQPIGWNTMDGNFIGNYKYSAYFTFKVKVQFAT